MNTKRDQLWKKTVLDQHERKCKNFVRLVVDSHIRSAPYGRQLLSDLYAAVSAREIKYVMQKLPLKESILWECSLGLIALSLHEPNDNVHEQWQRATPVVKLLTQEELQRLIKKGNLSQLVKDLTLKYANMQHLILYLSPTEKPSSAAESEALSELRAIHKLELKILPDAKGLFHYLKRLTTAIENQLYKQEMSEPSYRLRNQSLSISSDNRRSLLRAANVNSNDNVTVAASTSRQVALRVNCEICGIEQQKRSYNKHMQICSAKKPKLEIVEESPISTLAAWHSTKDASTQTSIPYSNTKTTTIRIEIRNTPLKSWSA